MTFDLRPVLLHPLIRHVGQERKKSRILYLFGKDPLMFCTYIRPLAVHYLSAGGEKFVDIVDIFKSGFCLKLAKKTFLCHIGIKIKMVN